MGKKSKQSNEFWTHLAAEVLTRLAYFVGTAILLFVLSNFGVGDIYFPLELMLVLAFATFAAVFGPYLYRIDAHRGRGSLKEIRAREREQDRD